MLLNVLRLSVAVLFIHTIPAVTAGEPLPLWPAEVPGEKGDIGEEKDMTKPTDGKVDGRAVIRIGNVSKPTLTVYKPAAEKDTGAAVLVCPGGGYHILAWDLEGIEVCEWLNSLGVTGVLLKYRVPGRKGQEKHLAPLQDAQRAMSLIRKNAAEWKIDPARIGILGFSAGGHLAAITSTNHETRSYSAVDAADELSARPDFSVLIYPAYLTVKGEPGTLAPDLKVGPTTPPAFSVMTMDDKIGVENIFTYSLALKAHKVAAEAHVYPKGGHGYGLRPSANGVSAWPRLVGDWMKTMGWLEKKTN